MTFRHPLRNEFDRLKPRLQAVEKAPGYEGATARAMLAIVPGFLELLEYERDHATAPGDQLHAMTSVIANLVAQTVSVQVQPVDQRRALANMLTQINVACSGKLHPGNPRHLPLILNGGG